MREPALDRRRDQPTSNHRDERRGQKRKTHENDHQLRLELRPQGLAPSLDEELDQVPREHENQDQEHGEVDQGEAVEKDAREKARAERFRLADEIRRDERYRGQEEHGDHEQTNVVFELSLGTRRAGSVDHVVLSAYGRKVK
jgi:hypothetical protein